MKSACAAIFPKSSTAAIKKNLAENKSLPNVRQALHLLQRLKSSSPVVRPGDVKILEKAAQELSRFEINFLEMTGQGLNDDEWRELDLIQIKPHFSSLPLGIKQAHWTRELVRGQAMQIQGRVGGIKSRRLSTPPQ
jgi:hypothetical protein